MRLKHFANEEPSNHRLRPGGTEYGRYLWVRDQIAPSAWVLDVGCNCGQLAENLTRDLGCRVVGVDAEQTFINYCWEHKEPFGAFLCEDFGMMSAYEIYAAGMMSLFDVVTALEVIEHPINVRGFLRNVCLALKPGGTLVVTTPHPHGICGYGLMRRYEPHVRMWTRGRLEAVFGPAEEYAEIRRDACGGLMSIGAVFRKE
jgi:2-polyprenyl-3-methyl-5-hydroxy-6-metoxy-1,4-benzoquinol methylase